MDEFRRVIKVKKRRKAGGKGELKEGRTCEFPNDGLKLGALEKEGRSNWAGRKKNPRDNRVPGIKLSSVFPACSHKTETLGS